MNSEQAEASQSTPLVRQGIFISMPTLFVVEANVSLGKDLKNLVLASGHVLSVLPVNTLMSVLPVNT